MNSGLVCSFGGGGSAAGVGVEDRDPQVGWWELRQLAAVVEPLDGGFVPGFGRLEH
jgi:hypothetical protein